MAATGLALTGYASVTNITPKQFGLRESFYVMTGNIMNPGIYFQFPFVQYTHRYETNTQVLQLNSGGCRFLPWCDSTGDHNPLTADMVLHYRVLPNVDKMNFHRWAMESWGTGRDGYWLITKTLNTAANTALGQKNMADTLKDPEGFQKAVYNDLKYRLEQNNIPVEIESLELKGFNTWYTPTRTVVYSATKNKPAAP